MSRQTVRTPWVLKGVMMGSALILSLLLVEVAVRYLVPSPPAPRRLEPAGFSPFQKEADGFYRYLPEVRFRHVYDDWYDTRDYFEDGVVDYRTNELGLRGGPIAPRGEGPGYRVLCLGDSFTFGQGVHEADTYPEKLAGYLKERDGVQVIDAGVQGYDLAHEIAFLRRYGLGMKPDVVTLGFVLNDLLPFDETVRDGVGVAAGTPEAQLSFISRISAVANLLERRLVARKTQERYFAEIRASFRNEHWSQAVTQLRFLAELSQSEGFRAVVVIWPLLYQLDEGYPFSEQHEQLRTACEELGLQVLDLRETFAGMKPQDLWVHPTDQHPNELAHDRAARAIAELLTEDIR